MKNVLPEKTKKMINFKEVGNKINKKLTHRQDTAVFF
jgi:hypothetical protein